MVSGLFAVFLWFGCGVGRFLREMLCALRMGDSRESMASMCWMGCTTEMTTPFYATRTSDGLVLVGWEFDAGFGQLGVRVLAWYTLATLFTAMARWMWLFTALCSGHYNDILDFDRNDMIPKIRPTLRADDSRCRWEEAAGTAFSQFREICAKCWRFNFWYKGQHSENPPDVLQVQGMPQAYPAQGHPV